MSEPRKAAVNKQWMPNLMFDSETNDFAIQNLLEKEGPQFVAGSERRAAAAFVVDRLGQPEDEDLSNKFVADNAEDEESAETDLSHALDHPVNAEPIPASPTEEEIQLAAAAQAEAEAAKLAAEQAAQLAAEQAAQQAAEVAATALVDPNSFPTVTSASSTSYGMVPRFVCPATNCPTGLHSKS